MVKDSLDPGIDRFINQWYTSECPNPDLSSAAIMWQLKFVFVVSGENAGEIERYLIAIIRKHQLTMLKPNEIREINAYLNRHPSREDPNINNDVLAVLRCKDGNLLIRKEVLETMQEDQVGQAHA